MRSALARHPAKPSCEPDSLTILRSARAKCNHTLEGIGNDALYSSLFYPFGFPAGSLPRCLKELFALVHRPASSAHCPPRSWNLRFLRHILPGPVGFAFCPCVPAKFYPMRRPTNAPFRSTSPLLSMLASPRRFSCSMDPPVVA
jgi:hypothetical protein